MSESEYAPQLTEHERAIRDRYVKEYLEDYDPVAALIRCGYAEQYARNYSSRFMMEPYVRNAISAKEIEAGVHTDQDQHRQKIIKGLYRIANSQVSSGAAKVGAYAQLSKVVGIEAPIKTQTVLPQVGGMDLSKLTDKQLASLEEILGLADAAPKPN